MPQSRSLPLSLSSLSLSIHFWFLLVAWFFSLILQLWPRAAHGNDIKPIHMRRTWLFFIMSFHSSLEPLTSLPLNRTPTGSHDRISYPMAATTVHHTPEMLQKYHCLCVSVVTPEFCIRSDGLHVTFLFLLLATSCNVIEDVLFFKKKKIVVQKMHPSKTG